MKVATKKYKYLNKFKSLLTDYKLVDRIPGNPRNTMIFYNRGVVVPPYEWEATWFEKEEAKK